VVMFGLQREDARDTPLVIPGRAEGASPESKNLDFRRLWIPGSALRAAPE